jgi:hypothetical protein
MSTTVGVVIMTDIELAIVKDVRERGILITGGGLVLQSHHHVVRVGCCPLFVIIAFILINISRPSFLRISTTPKAIPNTFPLITKHVPSAVACTAEARPSFTI